MKKESLPPAIEALLMPSASLYPQAEDWKPSQKKHSLSGDFRLHRQFPSAYLNYARDIIVYLPPGYKRTRLRRYPVLYMHDGNNIFDTATSFAGIEWQVDEHVESLVKAKQLEEIIVVGVYNSPDREFEYTWTPMLQADGVTRGGGGRKYARFLTEELKPFIDLVYRTRPEPEYTGVAGSSLGGLISFYLGIYYRHVYSRIGMLSPSLWWNHYQILEEVQALTPGLKLWVDMGTEEGASPEETITWTTRLIARLEHQGYVCDQDLRFWLDYGAQHNEAAWARRVGEMLLFFYPRHSPLKKPKI